MTLTGSIIAPQTSHPTPIYQQGGTDKPSRVRLLLHMVLLPSGALRTLLGTASGPRAAHGYGLDRAIFYIALDRRIT
jgi:hypothetical protein